MANVTAYVMTVWVNLPTKSSPIDASNLNHVEQGIKNVTDFVNTINAESGMYLSQTPFTTALKNKLDGIEANANNYTLPTASTSTKGGVKVDGTTITIDENGVITSTVSASQLSNLTDVNLTQLTDGQILKWDATNSKWVNSSEAEVRTQLALLEDVDITDPQDGDGLFYNGTTEKWENGPVEIGGDVLDYDDTMEVLGRPEPINSETNGWMYFSTVERRVGTWTDGKPIYAKTYEFNPALAVPNNSWVTFDSNPPSIDKVIFGIVLGSNAESYCGYAGIYMNKTNNELQVLSLRGAQIGVSVITVYYIKTTE